MKIIFLYREMSFRIVLLLFLMKFQDFFCESFRVYSFEEIQQNFMKNLEILESFIKNGKCEHFYVDMGTNIGIQLRKLYEPEYYPGAEVIPYFDSFYGSEKVNNRTRPYVCAIGFEPNHLHFERLILLQTKYRQAGYPMVVFLGTAIWIENKKLTFFQKPEANAKWNEWGSSLIKWNQHMIEQPVLGLDSAAFFHRIFTLWSNQFDRPTGCFNNTSLGVVEMGNCSRHINARDVKHKVLGKLDIEGAEYQVLPHLISHNVLCSFDELMIEFHNH